MTEQERDETMLTYSCVYGLRPLVQHILTLSGCTVCYDEEEQCYLIRFPKGTQYGPKEREEWHDKDGIPILFIGQTIELSNGLQLVSSETYEMSVDHVEPLALRGWNIDLLYKTKDMNAFTKAVREVYTTLYTPYNTLLTLLERETQSESTTITATTRTATIVGEAR